MHPRRGRFLPRSLTQMLRCAQVTFGGEILSNTDAPPVKKSSRALTYGPYENIGTSFANFWVKFHAVNNAPFAAGKSVHREIEVSHWGNIYVEERYLVVGRAPTPMSCRYAWTRT